MDHNTFREVYHGPPIQFFITGGGVSLANLGVVPGASSFLHSIIIGWAQDFLNGYCYSHTESFCSKEMTLEYYKYLVDEHGSSLLGANPSRLPTIVIVNAALPTIRTRQGSNRCWLLVRDKCWLMELPKELPYDGSWYVENKIIDYKSYIQDIRLKYDLLITNIVLDLLLRGKSTVPDGYALTEHVINYE